jgi:hypothetical protein
VQVWRDKALKKSKLKVKCTLAVPLKVLGSCHSGESTMTRKILEEVFEYLNEYNRPVYVKLEKEPDNSHDPNAMMP